MVQSSTLRRDSVLITCQICHYFVPPDIFNISNFPPKKDAIPDNRVSNYLILKYFLLKEYELLSHRIYQKRGKE